MRPFELFLCETKHLQARIAGKNLIINALEVPGGGEGVLICHLLDSLNVEALKSSVKYKL